MAPYDLRVSKSFLYFLIRFAIVFFFFLIRFNYCAFFFQIEHQRKAKLQPYDMFLKKFQYRNAMDAAIMVEFNFGSLFSMKKK